MLMLRTSVLFRIFHADGCKYDLETYGGRVCHFFDMVDLRNIFVTDVELQTAQSMLKDVKSGNRPACVTDEQLWAAKKS